MGGRMEDTNTWISPKMDRVHVTVLRLITIVVFVLSAKCVWDVIWAAEFPVWFGPGFALGVTSVSISLGYIAFGNYAKRETPSPTTQRIAWALLAVSFICASSLHGFHPFRLDVADAWNGWPSLHFNLVLAGAGFLITTVLGIMHAAGKREFAHSAMVFMTPILLIPNDSCANPFNHWWINAIGSSPLMFLPSVIGVILVSSALRGSAPKLCVWSLACFCILTLLLGFGHRTEIIW